MKGVEVIPLRRFEDERGWFVELRRESGLPKATKQTNISFSRKGVIRGLHYHERGQDDLFVCLEGRARVVVLDRETGATFVEDIGDDVLQRCATRGSFHAIAFSSGSDGSYSSVTW